MPSAALVTVLHASTAAVRRTAAVECWLVHTSRRCLEALQPDVPSGRLSAAVVWRD